MVSHSFVKSIWLHGIQFLLPEYLSVSKRSFFLFIAYIIFPDLFYYYNDHVIVEVMCSFSYYVENVPYIIKNIVFPAQAEYSYFSA